MESMKLLLLSLSTSLTLNVLIYPLILVNTKTNGLITLFKYSIKYLELGFASTDFEISILSTLASQISIYLFIFTT